MSKDKGQDPVEQLKEWEDHMYNKGYWVNRNNPFYPPKNRLESRTLTIIYILVLLPFTGLFVGFYIAERSRNVIAPMVVLLLLLILGCVNLWLQGRHRSKTKKQLPKSNQ